jgi:hypothetical protein
VEPVAPIHLVRSSADAEAALDAGHAALVEIDAAIALVLSGAARRVRLTALPFVDSIAAVALARARDAGLVFTFDRGPRVGVSTVTIGPIEPRAVGA